MTRRSPLRRPASLAALAAVLLLPACGADDAGTTDPAATGAADADLTGTLTVFGAASLRDVLEEIGTSFAAEHDGVDVTYSFAGSSDLVAQVEGGGRERDPDAELGVGVATVDEQGPRTT